MRIYVLTEPLFRSSPWCVRVLSGLGDALRAKKTDALYPDKPDDVPQADARDGDTFLLLIGCNPGWIQASVQRAAEIGAHPVLICGRTDVRLPCACSCVSSEPREASDYLLEMLKRDGRTAPALYGCNPASCTDLARKDCFLSNPFFRVSEKDIFYHEGSLSGCFSRFAERIGDYDSVICVNSYAALHLLRSLHTDGIGSGLRIMAFGDTLLARRYCPGLYTVSAQYEEFGRAALSVCELLAKNPALDALSVTVKWKITTPPEQEPRIPPAAPAALPTADERFYADRDMREMLELENMLSACGALQLHILDLAVSGESNEAIAAKCFLSENTVKYHLKKLRAMCGCKTKKELITRLRSYTAGGV